MKRIIKVTANKGGTGKTLLAMGMADYIRKKAVPACIFDSDTENPMLYDHYSKDNSVDPVTSVGQIDILDQTGKGIKDLYSTIKDLELPSLIDLPGGAHKYLFDLMDERRILQVLDKYMPDFRITFVTVLSRHRYCVQSFIDLVNKFQNNADYIVVKNLYWGDATKFKRFDASKLAQELVNKYDVKIIAMPELPDDVYDHIVDHLYPISDAIKDDRLDMFGQEDVYGWREKFFAQLETAQEYLEL